jgi:methylmalonyl-CoA mutase
VLCSSDPEYLAIATELRKEMKQRSPGIPVVVAGNPETAELLRAAGITEFVHMRSNPIELLTQLQQRLGIGQ